MTHSKLIEYHLLSHRASIQAKTSARFGVSIGTTSQALQMGWAVIQEGKTLDVVREITDYIGSILSHHGCIQARYLSTLLRRKGLTDRGIDARHIISLLELDSERELGFFLLDNDHNLVKNKWASNDNLLICHHIWDSINGDIKSLITIGRQRGIAWVPLQSTALRCIAQFLEQHSGIICSWRTKRAFHFIPSDSRSTSAFEIAFFSADSLPISRLVPALYRALKAHTLSSLIKKDRSILHCRDCPRLVEVFQILRNHPHCYIMGSSVYWCGRRVPLSREHEILVAVIQSQPISWTSPQLRKQLAAEFKSAGLPHSAGYIIKMIGSCPLLHVNTNSGKRRYRYHLIADKPLL